MCFFVDGKHFFFYICCLFRLSQKRKKCLEEIVTDSFSAPFFPVPEECLTIARLVLARGRQPSFVSKEWYRYSKTTEFVFKNETRALFFSLLLFFHLLGLLVSTFEFSLSHTHLLSRSSISFSSLLNHLKNNPPLFTSWVISFSLPVLVGLVEICLDNS